MKAFQISSPAYKYNALNGTYYSIAICHDNGDFSKIIGDHAQGNISDKFFFEKYTNIEEITDIPFSDSDRFIEVKEIEVNFEILGDYCEKMNAQIEDEKKWDEKHNAFVNEDAYKFCYGQKNKNQNEKNQELYADWKKNNPHPRLIQYYDFLKAIV